ncbi:hypothetical protein BJX64DRAFT_253107 [Aspergillus heterothallicus]
MTSSSPAVTRLHITPLNAEILHIVIPASIRPLATDISFHEIPTFPENNYGYVTLPAMEADKIKKKLNGSILKGRKFKVESARPRKRQREEEEEAQNNTLGEKSSSGKKKHKAEDNVIDGYELPPDRKIKRGWTESANDKADRRKREKKTKSREEKSSKSQAKSKYTEKAECLFRTKVPPNRASPEPEKVKKKPKKNKPSQESVVHEFSKTMTHPTFLRADDGRKTVTSTFDQDKGWIDDSGSLKEPVSERIRKDQYRPGQVAGYKEKPRKDKGKQSIESPESRKSKRKSKSKTAEVSTVESDSEDWTSSSGSSSSEDDGSGSESDDSDGSASSTSSDESDVSGSGDVPQPQKQPVATPDATEEQKEEEGGQGLSIASVNKPNSKTVGGEEQPTEVHPLEALFKKPAAEEKPRAEAPAQFSFFGQGEEESEDEEETTANIAPLTPFTKRDLQDRGSRSAAPTPDTSLVTKTINWNPSEPSETSLYADSPVSKPVAVSKNDSDFANWFWENRGDNNRAWKKRRRDAAKEQRQRENRRKGMKGKS